MRITVLCNKAGDIESVAILNAAPTGQFHIAIDGCEAHELELDDNELDRAALLGQRGPDAQRQVHDALRARLRR